MDAEDINSVLHGMYRLAEIDGPVNCDIDAREYVYAHVGRARRSMCAFCSCAALPRDILRLIWAILRPSREDISRLLFGLIDQTQRCHNLVGHIDINPYAFDVDLTYYSRRTRCLTMRQGKVSYHAALSTSDSMMILYMFKNVSHPRDVKIYAYNTTLYLAPAKIE